MKTHGYGDNVDTVGPLHGNMTQKTDTGLQYNIFQLLEPLTP